jgi:Uma2 family endonuclease
MLAAAAQPVTYGRDASIAKFSVQRYQRMIEGGVLTPEDRVELLENYVVLKMPGNPPHDGTIQMIAKRLGRRIPAGWDSRIQLSVVLPDSQPEPDIAICRGDETTYLSAHPLPTDVGLLIEVADSSLLRDQRDKARIYARAGIVRYWIVNLPERRIEVHEMPSGPTAVPEYSVTRWYSLGEELPLILDEQIVAMIPVSEFIH